MGRKLSLSIPLPLALPRLERLLPQFLYLPPPLSGTANLFSSLVWSLVLSAGGAREVSARAGALGSALEPGGAAGVLLVAGHRWLWSCRSLC